jgi:hypothetical protein
MNRISRTPKPPPIDHSKRLQWQIDLEDCYKARQYLRCSPSSVFTLGEIVDLQEIMGNFPSGLSNTQIQTILTIAVGVGFRRSTEKAYVSILKGNPS